ncbi:MAG TPA: hypothetical protein VHV30_04830 [Polyangiaceae bacterium]|nr:hypothetical protein [Polyangiaceae bacterium]
MVTALAAVVAAHYLGRDPRFLPVVFAAGLLFFIPSLLGRWRMRKLLMSGDVERVIGTWEGSIDRVPYHETMAPLLKATAYASYGWAEAARRTLERAVRGPAWDAAIEQRLFVETLLDTFEGDRDSALRKAQVLEALPMPAAGLFARRRVALLRRGLAALARAFAHESKEGDAKVLRRAADASPLVHWAMRYAAAIVAVDGGHPADVHTLLSGAPVWPHESAFHTYHDELLAHALA